MELLGSVATSLSSPDVSADGFTTVEFHAFQDQKPGTSGLRKKVSFSFVPLNGA
jgi:hypothetical protein